MNTDAWHDLFVACAGAGSALAGLIIVAMTVNIAEILQIPSMTSRAASTIAGLVLIVVVSCAGLVPGQPGWVLGGELALAGGLASGVALRSADQIFRRRPADVGTGLAIAKSALGLGPTAGVLVGGGLLWTGSTQGLYVTAAAIIAGFATSVTNAWVMLVEIRR